MSLARERAAVRLMHVLSPNLDLRATGALDHRAQVGEGNADADLDARHGGYAGQQSLDVQLGLGLGLVHLPVAGHERQAPWPGLAWGVPRQSHLRREDPHAGQLATLNELQGRPAAGREVVDRILEAEEGEAAAESPPPTTVTPRASATASAIARVPVANGGISKAPMGPFHKRSRIGDLGRVAPGCGRTDVQAHPAGGDIDAVEHPALGAGVESLGYHEVARQHQLGVGVAGGRRGGAFDGEGEGLPGVVDVLPATERISDLVALGSEKREAHRPPDHDDVGERQEALDHEDLVGDLRASKHGHERPGGVLQDVPERVDLPLQQPPRGARQQASHAGCAAWAR